MKLIRHIHIFAFLLASTSALGVVFLCHQNSVIPYIIIVFIILTLLSWITLMIKINKIVDIFNEIERRARKEK